MTDPADGVHEYSYDPAGRLTRDEDPSGAAQTLSRQELDDGLRVTLRSQEGRTSVYEVHTLAGGEVRRVRIDQSGARTVSVSTPGSLEALVTYPDGSTERSVFGPDPRFGIASPMLVRREERTPNGKVRTTINSRTVALADPADPLSTMSVTDQVTVDGATWRYEFTRGSPSTLVVTSPEGRVRERRFDVRGRLVELRGGPDLDPVVYTYGPGGQLDRIQQGARSSRTTTTHATA